MTQVLDPFDDVTWNSGEKLYFKQIDLALKESLDFPLSNGKPAHAVYLIDKFLRHATRHVRLYSGNLRRTWDDIDVYGHMRVLDAARVLLQRRADLSIVLEGEIDGGNVKEHPLIRNALKWRDEGSMKGVLDIRQADQASIDFLNDRDFNHHWMVMDERAYRLEADTGDVKAHVNFGNRVVAKALCDIFDKHLFRIAKPLIPSIGIASTS